MAFVVFVKANKVATTAKHTNEPVHSSASLHQLPHTVQVSPDLFIHIDFLFNYVYSYSVNLYV